MKHSDKLSDEAWFEILTGKRQANRSDKEQKTLINICLTIKNSQENQRTNSEYLDKKHKLLKKIKEKDNKSCHLKNWLENIRKPAYFSTAIALSISLVVIVPHLLVKEQDSLIDSGSNNTTLPKGMSYKSLNLEEKQVIYVQSAQYAAQKLRKKLVASKNFEEIKAIKVDNTTYHVKAILIKPTAKLESLKEQNIKQPITNQLWVEYKEMK